MDSMKFIDKTERYSKKIKEYFKELSTEELYEKWADSFEIENIDGKKVLITYHGIEDTKDFKKQCKKTLVSAVCLVMGVGMKVEISKKKGAKKLSPKAKTKIKAFRFFVLAMIFVCIATATIVLLCNYIGNRNFRETFYSASSIKVDSNIRVIQLSDLHGSVYGENNQKLIQRVKALKPDVIICTGDMVDILAEDEKNVVYLAGELAKIAPSYYVYGNNEVESIYSFPLNEDAIDEKFGFDETNRDETALLALEDSFEEKLENAGIKVLKNEMDTIKVKTMTVDIYGVLTSNPSAFWSYSEDAFLSFANENEDDFKIMAVHEPFIFEEFSPEFWGDLLVCGHTHGGIVRVPMIGPLYTTEGGLFPEGKGSLVYGRYDVAGSPLIVSSGLENSNVFRINNQPELVVIDINKF